MAYDIFVGLKKNIYEHNINNISSTDFILNDDKVAKYGDIQNDYNKSYNIMKKMDTYYGTFPYFLPYVTNVAYWLPYNTREMPDSLLIDNGRTDGFNKVSSLIPYISTKNYAKIDFQDFRFVPFMPDTFDDYGTGATKDLYENIPEYSFIEFLKFYIPYLGFEDDKQNVINAYDQMTLYSQYFTDTDEGHTYFDNMRMDKRYQSGEFLFNGNVIDQAVGFGYRALNGEVYLGINYSTNVKTASTDAEKSIFPLNENYYIDYIRLNNPNIAPHFYTANTDNGAKIPGVLVLSTYLGSLQVNGLGAMAAFQYLADTSKKNGIKNNPKPNTPYVFTNNAIGQSMFDAGEYTDEYDIGVRWSVDFDYQTTPGTIIITIQKGRPPSIPWNRLTFTRKSEYYKYATYHPTEKMMRYQPNIIKEVTADNSNYAISLISEDVNTNVVVYHAVGTGAVNLSVKIFNTQTWYHSNVKFAYSGTMPYWNYTLLNKSQIFAASETAISTHELYLTHPTKDSHVELKTDEIQAFIDLIKIGNNNYGYAITKAEQVNGLINNLALKFTITNTTEVALGEIAEIAVSVLNTTMNNAIIDFGDNFKVTHNKGENKIDPNPIPNPPSPPEIMPDPTPINPNPNPTPNPDPTPLPGITDNSTLPDGVIPFELNYELKTKNSISVDESLPTSLTLQKYKYKVPRRILLKYDNINKKYEIISSGKNYKVSGTEYGDGSFIYKDNGGIDKSRDNDNYWTTNFSLNNSPSASDTVIDSSFKNAFAQADIINVKTQDNYYSYIDLTVAEALALGSASINIATTTDLYVNPYKEEENYSDGTSISRDYSELFVGIAEEYYLIGDVVLSDYNIRRANVLDGEFDKYYTNDTTLLAYEFKVDSEGKSYKSPVDMGGFRYDVRKPLTLYLNSNIALNDDQIDAVLIKEFFDASNVEYSQIHSGYSMIGRGEIIGSSSGSFTNSGYGIGAIRGYGVKSYINFADYYVYFHNSFIVNKYQNINEGIFDRIAKQEQSVFIYYSANDNCPMLLSYKKVKNSRKFLIGGIVSIEGNELKIYYPNFFEPSVTQTDIVTGQQTEKIAYRELTLDPLSSTGDSQYYIQQVEGILHKIGYTNSFSILAYPMYSSYFFQRKIYDEEFESAMAANIYADGIFNRDNFDAWVKENTTIDQLDIGNKNLNSCFYIDDLAKNYVLLAYRYIFYPENFSTYYNGFSSNLYVFADNNQFFYFKDIEYWYSVEYTDSADNTVALFYFQTWPTTVSDLAALNYLSICAKSNNYKLKAFKKHAMQHKLVTQNNITSETYSISAGNPINATIISSQ